MTAATSLVEINSPTTVVKTINPVPVPAIDFGDNETVTEALTETEADDDLRIPNDHSFCSSQLTQSFDEEATAGSAAKTAGVPRLLEGDEEKIKPELDWSFQIDGQLFGRDQEITALQDAFTRRTAQKEKAEFVLVSGQSGTGKTALVKHALKELAPIFLIGKFDQLRSPEPYGPFVAALTQLAIHIDQIDNQSRMILRQKILTDVGMEACHVLCALVPAFAWVLGLSQERLSLKTHDAQQDRLKVALTKLLQVICSQTQPIALCLDDLQWADSRSLDILESLASDTDLEGLLVVGICRSNEVPWHHDFAGMLRRLEDEKETSIVHIEVNSLSVEATNLLLSEMLKQPEPVCLPLAEIINQKSEGNVFFMLYLLRTLYEENILVAEFDTHSQQFQWLWNDDRWDLPSFQQDGLNVVDLVSNHIRKLPADCRRFLKVAASMGAEFDLAVLEKVMAENASPLPAMEMLSIALEQDLVVVQMHRPGRFGFAHDRIQQAAYSLIPEGDKPRTHLTIGKSLFFHLSPEELENNLFLVVNQLLRGMTLLTAEVDKIGLANLCLRAGKKAFEASDFDIALSYFRSGQSLLPQRHWRDEYHLSLDLYNSKAEVECCVAAFELMDDTVEEILTNCRSPNDKIRSHLTKIYSLGVRAEFERAINLGMEVMASLGEKFPSKPRIIYLIPELLQVRRQLKSKTDVEILRLPIIDDKHKVAVMSILNLLSIYVFCADPDVFPFLVVRWIKLTLKYGLSDAAGLGFASYGCLLVALGEFNEGYRYARLGQQLLEACSAYSPQATNFRPRLNFLLYAMVSPWKRPLRSCFDPLKQAMTHAIDTGDFECCMFTSYSYILLTYAAGHKLQLVEERSKPYMKIMRNQGGPWLAFATVHMSLLNNFMGNTEDPLKLDFGKISDTIDNKNDFVMFEHAANTTQLTLAYHFGDLVLALSSARKSRLASEATKTVFPIVLQHFYDAMTALEAAQACGFGKTGPFRWTKRYRYLWVAHRYIKRFEFWASEGPDNILHKLYLLRGEEKAAQGKLAKAMEWYEKAASSAANERVLQMEGLAYERWAVALQGSLLRSNGKGVVESDSVDAVSSSSSRPAEVQRLLYKAIDRYQEWGAFALVDHLKTKHGL